MTTQRVPRGAAFAAVSAAVAYAVLHQLWLRGWLAESAGLRVAVPAWIIAVACGIVFVASAAVAGLAEGPHWRWVTIVAVTGSLVGSVILASVASYAFQRAQVFKDVTPVAQLWAIAPILIGGVAVCALSGLVPAWRARKLAQKDP